MQVLIIGHAAMGRGLIICLESATRQHNAQVVDIDHEEIIEHRLQGREFPITQLTADTHCPEPVEEPQNGHYINPFTRSEPLRRIEQTARSNA